MSVSLVAGLHTHSPCESSLAAREQEAVLYDDRETVISMSWVLEGAFAVHNVTAAYCYDHYLYVGNDDNCIRMWNVRNGQLYLKITGHKGRITGFTYAPRYDLLFSCSIDGSIITWHNGTMVYRYLHFIPPETRFPAPVFAVWYHEEAEVLVAGFTGYVVTFELAQQVVTQIVMNSPVSPIVQRQARKIHSDRVIAITGSRRKVFTCAYDKTVCSTSVLDLCISRVISKGQTSGSAMIFDQFSQSLVVGDHSGALRGFSTDGLGLGPLTGALNSRVVSMFLDAHLKLLWFILADGSINLLDPASPNELVTSQFDLFKNLPVAGAESCKFELVLGNGLGTRIIAVVNHKYIYTWKWSDTACILKLNLMNKPVNCVLLYDYREDDLGFLEQPLTIPPKARDVKDGEKKKDNLVKKRVRTSLVSYGLNLFGGGSTTVACKPMSKYVYKTEELMQEPDASAIEFSVFEAALFLGFKSGKVRVLSLYSGRSFTSIHTEGFAVTKVLTFEDMAITVSSDWSVCLWKLTDDSVDRLYKRDRAHDCDIVGAAYCDATRQFITCDTKGFCRLWEVTEDQFKERLLVDQTSFGGFISAAYSSSMESWVFATNDHFIRAWSTDLQKKEPTFQYCVSPCNITTIAVGYASDVYFATDDKTIRAISMRTSEELGVFVGHTQLITGISITRSGQRWCSLQLNGEVYFWLVPGFARMSETPPLGSALSTSRLPRLSQKQAQSKQVTQEEPMVSLYEKSRKKLLLRRREEERQLRLKKKTPAWRKITQIQQNVMSALSTIEDRKNGVTSTRRTYPASALH